MLGLIGENGAGKSTMMKVLGGVIAPTSGTIVIDGVEHARLTVTQATTAGIAFVHQELNLFENLDVAQNVFIGREPGFGGMLKLVDERTMHARVKPLLERLGVDFEPTDMVENLSIAQRQMVEIAKALSLDARVIIMDEPTSSLTLTETDRLLEVIADLQRHGVSTIYISHRLGEVKTLLRPRYRPARRTRRGRAGQRRADPRRDGPDDDRARPQVALYSAKSAAEGDAGSRSRTS